MSTDTIHVASSTDDQASVDRASGYEPSENTSFHNWRTGALSRPENNINVEEGPATALPAGDAAPQSEGAMP